VSLPSSSDTAPLTVPLTVTAARPAGGAGAPQTATLTCTLASAPLSSVGPSNLPR
jgi:hypothetical protein